MRYENLASGEVIFETSHTDSCQGGPVTLKKGSSEEGLLTKYQREHNEEHRGFINGLASDGQRGARPHMSTLWVTNEVLPNELKDTTHEDQLNNDLRRHPKDRGILGHIINTLNQP